MPSPLETERASACEWARSVLLSANLAWTTLCLGGVLPETRVVTILLTAALGVVHFGDRKVAGRAHPAGWFLVPFLAYAAANTAWVTPFYWLGRVDWLNWMQAAFVFWITLNGIRSRPCRALVMAVLGLVSVCAATLALYQHFGHPTWIMLVKSQATQFIGRSSGPFGIPNSLGVFAALLIAPAVALAWDRSRDRWVRLGCGLVAAALGAAFVLAVSRGAWVALAVAVSLRPLLVPGRSLGWRLGWAALALASAAALAATLYYTFPPMRTRVDQLVADAGEKSRPILWRGAWRIFESKPVFGGGAGGFDPLFEKYRPLGFQDDPVYAHCDYLNTLCDYGAVGFLLLAVGAGAIAWKVSGARGIAGAAVTGLLAFALHLLIDFHLKIPALALTFAVVSAWVTQEAWPYLGPPEPRWDFRTRCLAMGAGAGFALLAVTWAVPLYRADGLRRVARLAIDRMGAAGADVTGRRAELALARNQLSEAVKLDPRNAQAWADKAYADSLWALVEPRDTPRLGAQVEREASVALGLCPLVAEFWIRKGTGLDMQARWVEGGDCVVRALQLAPGRADVWYYQAYHLSLNPTEVGPALAAAEVSLRLDPSFLLAQVLRQRLGASP